jgi:hypothetical protein
MFLGVTSFGNNLNLKYHTDYILPKLNVAGCLIEQLFYVLNLEILRMAYFAYLHSVIRYGLIIWGNAMIVVKFSNQKRVIRIMSGAEPRASCRVLFRKLEIFPVSYQCILGLMLFIIDRSNNFQTDLERYGVHTMSENQLFIPIANLTNIQKGITCSHVKTCTILQSSILNDRGFRKQFKNKL